MFSDAPQEAISGAKNMMDAIGKSPMGGQTPRTILGRGQAQAIEISWGVGSGAYLLLAAGILGIFAGILELIANASLFEPGKP